MSVVTWFLGTKLGRGIAFGAVFCALVAVAWWRVFTSGKQSARVEQDRQSVENYRTRQEVSDEVASRPADDRRRELGRWVQPD